MGLLQDIIKGMTQGGQGGGLGDVLEQMNRGQQQQQQQYPQQGNPGQPSGDISIVDLERQMGIGNKGGNTGQQYPQQQYPQQQYPQQQYPQQQYPQQQYPQQTGGSGIPGLDDYLPTTQNDNNLPTPQQQMPGCSGGGMPGCSGNLWKILGLGALMAFLFRRKG